MFVLKSQMGSQPRNLISNCHYKSLVSLSKDSAVYPEIKEVSFQTRIKRSTQEFAESIKSKSSFEEKMIEINLPRKYGWATYLLTPIRVVYGSQGFYQKVTKTGLVPVQELPGHAQLPSVDIQNVKNKLVDAVEHELDYFRSLNLSPRFSSVKAENLAMSHTISSVITRVLMTAATHHSVDDVEIEETPRCEAFWTVGGFDPSPIAKKFRTKLAPEWLRKELKENDPVHYNFQYIGKPSIQLQSRHPIASSVPQHEGLSKEIELPEWRYQPSKVGVTRDLRYATNVSATWPCHNDRAFTILSWLPYSFAYSKNGHNDIKEHSDNLAMLHGFGSMSAQAARLGFSHLNNITYPMSTQMVVGDGQYLSFYQYQMNSNVMHPYVMEENSPNNICWATPMVRLYESFEGGKLIGVDDSVLSTLFNMYRSQPQEANYELSPFLGEPRYLADLPNQDKRIALDRYFKDMYSNRDDRRRARPIIYDWERIYKIYFNMRPQDARRKWWAKGEKILKDRYDDVIPPYVPKHLQNPPKRSRRGRSVTKIITA